MTDTTGNKYRERGARGPNEKTPILANKTNPHDAQLNITQSGMAWAYSNKADNPVFYFQHPSGSSFVMNPDGSHGIRMVGEGRLEAHGMTITTSENIDLAIGGHITVKTVGGMEAQISGDGQITVAGATAVNLIGDAAIAVKGNCSMGVEGHASISAKGGLNLRSGGDMTIGSKGGLNIQAGGGIRFQPKGAGKSGHTVADLEPAVKGQSLVG